MVTADEEYKDACQLGRNILKDFESHHNFLRHPPHFVPMARALLFYTSTRAGFGLGVDRGRGFMISRCADGVAIIRRGRHGDLEPFFWIMKVQLRL